jgi:hypothetical protein
MQSNSTDVIRLSLALLLLRWEIKEIQLQLRKRSSQFLETCGISDSLKVNMIYPSFRNSKRDNVSILMFLISTEIHKKSQSI